MSEVGKIDFSKMGPEIQCKMEISLRDQIAMAWLSTYNINNGDYESISKECYAMADAMLLARDK
jgi:hypothetical protein